MELKNPIDMGKSVYNICGRHLGAPLTQVSALFVSIDKKDGKILRTIEPVIDSVGVGWLKERMVKVAFSFRNPKIYG
jgi:hypothetical protein